MISQVLLHSLKAGYKFYNSTIGTPTFKQIVERGRPEDIWEYKNFFKRYCYFSVLSSTASIESYVFNSPDSLSKSF